MAGKAWVDELMQGNEKVKARDFFTNLNRNSQKNNSEHQDSERQDSSAKNRPVEAHIQPMQPS